MPLAYLLPQIWRALIQGPRTVDYPFAPAKLPDGYRGRVQITNPDECRGCGLCARDCPAMALELQRESRKEFKLIHYPERCAYCGQCEISCVTGSLHLSNDYVSSTPDLKTLTVTLVERTDDSDS